MFDSTSLPVSSTDGFKKGHRIFIGSGMGAGEILVIKKVNSSTVMTVRRYNIFDKVFDWYYPKWMDFVISARVWLDAHFGKNEDIEWAVRVTTK